MGFLRIEGRRIVDEDGRRVALRGFGLGGWMNMENFITGHPATEQGQREAVEAVLGPALAERFFDLFLHAFFGEADARFVASLGLELVRLPVNYRHLERDDAPGVIREEGFAHLDRVVAQCGAHGVRTILDLHALPGSQNQDWHSDNPTHQALFWRHRHFQDRVVGLWEAIADRYRDNPWVAGYNPVNEPADPTEERLLPFYRRLYDAIRAVDPRHILFLEGNRYSQDFHLFDEPWDGVVYSNHDYAPPGFAYGGPYPGVTRSPHAGGAEVYVDRDALERTFLQRSEFMLRTETPIWVGEFGPVYTGDPERDAMRYRLLRDQLEIYDRYEASWSLWTYKDIGLQGVVHAAADSPWMRRIEPVLAKKQRLGVDAWGSTDAGVREVIEPIEALFAREYPDFAPFPWGRQWWINRLVRHILLAEPMLAEFGACFAGLDEAGIAPLMESFAFASCTQREELAAILRDHARLPGAA